MSDNGTHIDLRQAVKNLDALPAMPVIAQKLLALEFDTLEGEQRLLLLVDQDPQIAAKIIGLANSAAIGSTRRAATTLDAVLLLGLTRVKSVSTGIAIMSLMNPPSGRLNVQGLWAHSFGIAFAMMAIARAMPAQLRPHDDPIFLAGLLHDLGYMALAIIDPRRSDKLHARLAAEPARPALEIEREILEMTHDELGAELARHWRLPEEIQAVLRYHHTPEAAQAPTLARMVVLAERLLPSFGIGEYVEPVSDGDWEALGIDPARADEVHIIVREYANQAMQFMSAE